MSTWKINLKEQTATSINGIIFKLTEKDGEYEGGNFPYGQSEKI